MKGFHTRKASQSALPQISRGGEVPMSVVGSKYESQSSLGAILETCLKHRYLLGF